MLYFVYHKGGALLYVAAPVNNKLLRVGLQITNMSFTSFIR